MGCTPQKDQGAAHNNGDHEGMTRVTTQTGEQEDYFLFLNFWEDISPFCWVTDTPVLDF